MIDFNDKKIWFNNFKRNERERLFKLYYPANCYCELNNSHIDFIYDSEHLVR